VSTVATARTCIILEERKSSGNHLAIEVVLLPCYPVCQEYVGRERTPKCSCPVFPLL